MSRREPRSPDAALQPPRGARLWLFRLTAALLLPILILGLAEAGLRLAGVGYSPQFLVPVAERPGLWTSNPRFGWRFFPPVLARTPVPFVLDERPESPRSYRIFVIGGSAARGTPDSAYSFGRMLEAMLAESYPETRFEVVNAAMTAINSHVVLPIVRSCARHDPDLFIVYLGNNEVVGPWGPATVFQGFSPNLAAIRANVALKTTRLGQVLDRALAGRAAGGTQSGWRGMEMFLERRIAADDPRLAQVRRHFERNLGDVVRTAAAAGADSLLLTVATNLRDQPPFASLKRSDLGARQEDWQRAFDQGRQALREDRPREAADALRRAAEIDDSHAELQFQLGRAFAALGRSDAARDRFVRARDLDALRFRADSEINDAVRRVAARNAGSGVVLVDAERALGEVSEGGIPGRDLFYEHVHLNLTGNYQLASAVFRQLQAEGLLPAGAPAADPQPPTPERIAERLALTPFDAYDLERAMLELTSRPPFTGQAGHDETLARDRRQLAQMRRLLTPELWASSEPLYRRQLEERPADLELRRRFAENLQARGKAGDAAAEWRALDERLPGVVPWRASLALALADLGRGEEAEHELRRLIAGEPQSAALHANLGTVLEKLERFDEAADRYRRASELDPGDPLASFNLGTLYLRRGESERAIAHLRELIELHPDFAPAHHNLGHALEVRGDRQAAIASYRKAVAARPDRASARNSLAMALEAEGKAQDAFEQYRVALAWEPGFTPARFNLADLLFSLGRAQDAEAHYREGLRTEPGNVQARYNWAGTLQVLGQAARAAAEFQRVIDERGEDPGALNNLAWILATVDDPALRDLEAATDLAERAARASDYQAPEVLDTLATVYRAAGRDDDARATLERALEAARNTGREDLAAVFAQRLAEL